MEQLPTQPIPAPRDSQRQPASRLRLALLCFSTVVLAAIGSVLGHGFAAPAQSETPTRTPVGDPVASRPSPSARPIVAAPTPTAPPSSDPPAVAVVEPAATATPTLAGNADSWVRLEGIDQTMEQWPTLSAADWSSGYRGGSYQLRLDGRRSISYSVPLQAHDFELSASVRMIDGQAGLFFLLGPPNDFYRFLIDLDGQYRLERQRVGVSVALIDWRPSAALRRGASVRNQIAVQRNGDELTLYANDTLLARYALAPGNALQSRVGLALDASVGRRRALALFDELIVRGPVP